MGFSRQRITVLASIGVVLILAIGAFLVMRHFGISADENPTAPTIVSATTYDADGDGHIDGYNIEFSKMMNHSVTSSAGFSTTSGYTFGAEGSWDDRGFYSLPINEKTAFDTGVVPDLSYSPASGDFRDESGNECLATIVSNKIDGARPTAALTYSTDGGATWASTAVVKDANTLRIKATFSEELCPVEECGSVGIQIDNDILSWDDGNMTEIDSTHYYYDLDVPGGDIAVVRVSVEGRDRALAHNISPYTPISGATFTINNSNIPDTTAPAEPTAPTTPTTPATPTSSTTPTSSSASTSSQNSSPSSTSSSSQSTSASRTSRSSSAQSSTSATSVATGTVAAGTGTTAEAVTEVQADFETEWLKKSAYSDLDVKVDVDLASATNDLTAGTLTGVRFVGTAPAEALVEVSVYSTKITKSVSAGADGNWSITLENALASGAHTVYLTVTKNGLAARAVSPIIFTVNAADKTVTQEVSKSVEAPAVSETASSKKSFVDRFNNIWVWAGAGALLVLVLVILLIRKIRAKKDRELVSTTQSLNINDASLASSEQTQMANQATPDTIQSLQPSGQSEQASTEQPLAQPTDQDSESGQGDQ